MSRWLLIISLAAGALLLMLVAAAPAFAADGVRVMPANSGAGTTNQSNADVSGPFMAFIRNTIPPSDDTVICLKSLLDDAPPWQISRPDGYKDFNPRILYENVTGKTTIWVVWTRMNLTTGDADLWLWKGTYSWDPNGDFTPADDGYPKLLVSGTTGGAAPTTSNQWEPSIGLVHESDGDHVVVAWEDSRDNGWLAPLIYSWDLTADTSYQDIGWATSDGPGTAGAYLDYEPPQARGQFAPDVGYTGVYWLDDRWSFLNSDWTLKDTAVWRADPANSTAGPYFSETDRANDNGSNAGGGPGGNELGPRVTGNGVAWLRSGPYGDPDAHEPVSKAIGGSAAVFAPMAQPDRFDTWYTPGQSATAFAIMGHHAGSAKAIDYDVFFYDPATRQAVPVCDIGWPPGTDPDSVPSYYTKQQADPAIGPAYCGYRVVWTDFRDSASATDDSLADSRLYEAFVPTVSIKSSASALRLGKRATISATVAPNYATYKVRLQLVRATRTYGATQYTVLRSALSTTKALSIRSAASWTFKPTRKGAYLVRIYFYGGAKYTYNGTAVASGGDVAIPHIPNVSKVLRIVVK
jgi:hypothetical protein